jgi:hypothetical protein
MYQKSKPCASIRKWSTIVKKATQITSEIIPYKIFWPIIPLLIRSIKDSKHHARSGPELAGALNAGEPIEKP